MSSAGAARITRAYATGSSGQIHYRRSGPPGTRSPLLLLHPCPGTGLLYEGFMAEMGRERTVIAPDLPGQGMSDAPESLPTIATYAAAMLELEAELGLGLFDVMGYHAGGAVALEMARQQPNAVRKVVLIAAPIFTPEESARLLGHLSERTPDQRAEGMAKGWQGFKTGFWTMDPSEGRTWNIYLDGQKNADRSLWGLRAMVEYDTAKALAEITQPVLVLNPDDDMKEHTARAKPLLKNGQVYALPGWTHGFLEAKSAETAEIVRGFLDG